MVSWPFLLEGSSPVLEELLLPAVEDRGMQAEFIAELRDRLISPADAASGWRLSPPACSASVASSCVLSFTLLGERLLHFQLNRNKRPVPRSSSRIRDPVLN